MGIVHQNQCNMKTKLIILLGLIGLSYTSNFAQRPPEEFLLKGEQPIPVLLVGTFHFRYPGLDSHKTAEENKVDVLSPRRQAEMRELVDYIARFKPTHIVVEGGRNTGYLLRRYERWQTGEYDLRRQEIDQIAFPLMKRFGLDTLYGCDAPSLLWSTLRGPDSTAFKKLLSRYEAAEEPEDPMDDRYYDWYDYTDQYALEHTLLETFQVMNDPHHIKTMHGHYLVGSFKTGEFEGADLTALNWYNRNLRIFRLVQRIGATKDDRIMVLFGAGHMAILAQQFEASPEYQLIPFSALADRK